MGLNSYLKQFIITIKNEQKQGKYIFLNKWIYIFIFIIISHDVISYYHNIYSYNKLLF